MTNRGKVIVSNVLIIFGFLSLVAAIVMFILKIDLIVGIISAFLTALISLGIGFYFWKTSDHPVTEQPQTIKAVKKTKPNKYKVKKQKKPFISDKEWEEFEEEDDEMMFIDEVVEDD